MNISFSRHTLRLRRPIPSATGGNLAYQDRLYVRLELNDGTVGYGEAAPHPTRERALHEVELEARRWICEQDDDWLSQWEKAQLCLQMAAIDALARQQNVPAWSYLRLPAPPRSLPTLLTFGGTPGQIRRQVSDERPVAVKLKLVGDDQDWERVQALRGVFHGPFAVDVNAAWATWDLAATKLEQLKQIVSPGNGLLWVEQPCPAEKMREHLPTDFPIFADEAVMHPAFRWHHYDGIVIKPAASAPLETPATRGLAKCIELAEEAADRDVLVTLGCHLQSSLLTAASLQLAGLVTADWLDLDSALLVEGDPFSPPCVDSANGGFFLDAATGFGRTPLEITWQSVS